MTISANQCVFGVIFFRKADQISSHLGPGRVYSLSSRAVRKTQTHEKPNGELSTHCQQIALLQNTYSNITGDPIKSNAFVMPL